MGISVESADIDFNGSSFKDSAIGGNIGVFIAISELASVHNQIDDS